MIVERDFADHWKTELLVKRIGAEGVRCLLRLWAHCEARRSATFEDMPSRVLAAVCRFEGSPRSLEAALLESKWVERSGKKLTVRGWAERNRKLLSDIQNGKKGGRPKKATHGEPSGNPSETHGFSKPNPQGTSKRRVEESREDNPLSSPAGGPAIADCGSRIADSSPELPPSPNGHSSEKKETGGPGAMLEAWEICCGIFGRKKGGLSHKVQFALAELQTSGVLPLAEAEAETLTAFYAAARRDTESRALWHPRDTAETLAENLPAELDKARQWARETDFTGEKKKGAAEIDADALRAWCRNNGFPTEWRAVSDLPRDVVREFKASQQQHEGSAA